MGRRRLAESLRPHAQLVDGHLERVGRLVLVVGAGQQLPPAPALAQGVEQVDRGGRRARLLVLDGADAAVGLDVVDQLTHAGAVGAADRAVTHRCEGAPPRYRGLGRQLVEQPPRLVVHGADVPELDVVGPVGVALPPAGTERQPDEPGAVRAPRVPRDGVGVDLARGQALGDQLVEGRIGAGRPAAAAAHPHGPRLPRHELALGEHGALVPPDVLERDAGVRGHLFGGVPGPDPRLDVLGAQGAGLLVLELPEARAVAPDSGPQRLVDRHPVPVPVRADEDEVLPVVMDADQREVLHGVPSARSAPYRHPSTLPSAHADTKHPGPAWRRVAREGHPRRLRPGARRGRRPVRMPR